MDTRCYDMGHIDVAWCPGCGNFGILSTLKNVLAELDIVPEKLVMVSGIGQAEKHEAHKMQLVVSSKTIRSS